MITMSPSTHTPRSTSEGLERLGSLNHRGPVMPKNFSTRFTGPVPGLNRKTKATTEATGGTSAGR